ncbi:hypothetical protein ACR9PT_02120 [Piscirickettsia salmonis]|uniref:hypothetical protein n=1 Tax=Piscirickettsia salmonis TaxID=1238 RepID=UPI003EC0D718
MKFFCTVTYDNYSSDEMFFYAIQMRNSKFAIKGISKEAFLKLSACPQTQEKQFIQISNDEYHKLLNEFKEKKGNNLKKEEDDGSFHPEFVIDKETFNESCKNKKSHRFIGMDIFSIIKEKNNEKLEQIAKLDKSYLSKIDENGNTPLATAITYGNIKALQVLKKYGVDIKQNINNTSPIDLAKQHNQTKVIRFYENNLLFEKLIENIVKKENIDDLRKVYNTLIHHNIVETNIINNALNNHKLFKKIYRKLHQLDMIKKSHIKYALENPKKLNHLTRIVHKFNLHYSARSIDDIGQFFRDCDYLESHNMLKEDYITTIIYRSDHLKEEFNFLLNEFKVPKENIRCFYDLCQLLYDYNLESDNKKYVVQYLNQPDLLKKVIAFLKPFDVKEKKYIKKALNNPSKFCEHCQLLDENSINSPLFIEKIMDNSKQFKKNYNILKKLNLIETEHLWGTINSPTFLEENYKRVEKLYKVYTMIVKKLDANQLEAHGFNYKKRRKAGINIVYKGETKRVPDGIGKIWQQITDRNGEFKAINDHIHIAFNNSQSEENNRKNLRKKSLATYLFAFGSHRDSRTRSTYQEISQCLSAN